MNYSHKIRLYLATPLSLEGGEGIIGGSIPFLKEKLSLYLEEPPQGLRVGDYIGRKDAPALFQIEDIQWRDIKGLREKIYLLRSLGDLTLDQGWQDYLRWKEGYTLAVITLSDKGFKGERIDTSGPIIEKKLRHNISITMSFRSLIGDDERELLDLLIHYALTLRIDIIVTTGGTGVTSRDITPDVTEKIVEKRLRGFEYRLFSSGIKKTPHAIISRTICGTLHSSLIINLPGSPKGAEQGIDAIIEALPHTLEKLQDSPIECGENPL